MILRGDLIKRLDRLEKGNRQIMATLADINAGIVALNTSFTAELAAIVAAIAAAQAGGSGSISATDADGIKSALGTLQQRIDDETAALTAAPATTP